MKGSIHEHHIGKYRIQVYEPPVPPDRDYAYPVLYVQDGNSLIVESIDELESRFSTGALPELLLVGIEPLHRLDEYTPWSAPPLVEGRPGFGGDGDAYLAFLIHQVKPYVEAQYRVQNGPSHTGMIGASLGGLISMYAAFKYGDVFGLIGSISGSYWYPGIIDFMRSHSLETTADKQRFYLSVGTKEGEGKTNVQKDMMPLTFQAFDTLLVHGVPPENIRFMLDTDAVHCQASFVERFPEAVEWLFKC